MDQQRLSLRVLVVDDNLDSAESLAMLLRLGGHDVCTAHDGPAGLNAARGFRPDVLVLDIGLPGFDGYELAERLQHEMGAELTMLVAISGYPEDKPRSLSAGFTAHLMKPVPPERLRNLIRHAQQLKFGGSSSCWRGEL